LTIAPQRGKGVVDSENQGRGGKKVLKRGNEEKKNS